MTSDLILSASANPPTVQLGYLRSKEAPTLLQPAVSSEAVVAAAFHPDRGSIFLLAFADGTLAVYDAVGLMQTDDGKGGKSPTLGSGRGGEIAYFKSTNTSSADDWVPPLASVGDVILDIIAVAFVPGSTCTAVSVGTDGRCHVIDFASKGPSGAEVTHSWYLGSAATALSIIPTSCRSGAKANLPVCLIAIGCSDGIVRLFNLEGEPQGQHIFGTEGSQVLDVEWLEGPGIDCRGVDSGISVQSEIPGIVAESSQLKTIKTRNRYQSVQLKVRRIIPSPYSTLLTTQLQTSLKEPTGPLTVVPSVTASSISSPKIKIDDTTLGKAHTLPTEAEKISLDSSATVLMARTVSSSQETVKITLNKLNSPCNLPKISTRRRSPPQTPPRPVGRKGGKYALRRAEIARMTSVTPDEVKVLRIHSRLASARLRHGGDGSYPIGMQQSNTMPDLPAGSPMPSKELAQSPWMDGPFTPAPSSGKESTQSSASRSTMRSLLRLPPRAISSNETEASNDTVIDWRPSYKNAGGSPLKAPTSFLASASNSSKLACTGPTPSISKPRLAESKSTGEDSSTTNTTINSWTTRPLPAVPGLQRSPRKYNLLEDPSAPVNATPRRTNTSTRSLAPSSVMRGSSTGSDCGTRSSVEEKGLGDGDKGKAKKDTKKEKDVEGRLQERMRALEADMTRLRELVESALKVSKSGGKK